MTRRSRRPDASLTRRGFIGKTTAGLGAMIAAPLIVPSSVFGATAPSERVTIGCIGVGRMGLGDMQALMAVPGSQVVAVCDVNRKRADHARGIVDRAAKKADGNGGGSGCTVHADFREVIGRDDIDAVLICTPDHWHAIPAIAAARAGKDVYLEKPMTFTVEEGRVLSDTVRRWGRILQVGSQQRSDARFRKACELVRNGRIGALQKVTIGLPIDPGGELEPEQPIPQELDYEAWLGPAPWAPYTEKRVQPLQGYSRPGWLRIRDYCCGMITGWGSHHLDIARWGMGPLERGPVEVSGSAEFPADGLWNVHGRWELNYRFASGVVLVCTDNGRNQQGVRFDGTEGWIHVRRGAIAASDPAMLRSRIGPDEEHLYESAHHHRNFIECVRSRREPVAPVENGHRSNSLCLIGDVAMNVDRPLTWDLDHELFIDDDEANRMLARPMRDPWTLA